MVLCEFGFDRNRLMWDVGALFIFGGICCFVTYFILLASGWDLSSPLNLNKIEDLTETTNSESTNPNALHRNRGRFLDGETGVSFSESQSAPLLSQIDSGSFLISDFIEGHSIIPSTSLNSSNTVGFVRLSKIKNSYFQKGDASQEHLTISWQDIKCIVSSTLLSEERIILKNISGIAGPLPIAPTHRVKIPF